MTHYCVMCGKVGAWDEGWYWYGSIRDLEDGAGVFCFCSHPCRELWEHAVKLVATPPLQRSRLSPAGPYLHLQLEVP